MDVQRFEKIVSNTDIIIKIFKLLNCDDQLRLAQVNSNLDYIFKELIWKRQDYSTLNLIFFEGDYIVANESNSHRKLLTEAGLQEFKSLYAVDVHKFKFEVEMETMEREEYSPEIMQCLSGALFYGINHWINLTSVECSVPNIPPVVKLLCRHLPNLNRIHLDEIVWAPERQMETEEIESLLKMKNLKRLSLNYLGRVTIKCQTFCQLIYELQLEVMEGAVILVHDDCKKSKSYLSQELSLKELKIWAIFNHVNPLVNYATILKIFENITKLHLKLSNYNSISEGLNEMVWTTIKNACKNLNTLTIELTTFENITTFSLPSTVTKFHLKHCRGLTHKNLQHILTQTNITELISKDTYYYPLSEDFEDISISPLIERLDVDALDLCRFSSIYQDNKTLKHLTWHHIECLNSCSTKFLPECGSQIQSCENLESLEMPLYGQMSNNAVLQLMHLRKLTISLVSESVWSDICALLRHPPLRELNIRGSECELKPQIKGFSTDVNFLSLSSSSWKFIDQVLDFFLDFLRKNSDLQLAFLCHFTNPKKMLKRLITSVNFPRDLRDIQVCGFTINSSELRNNFDETLKTIRCPPYREFELDQIVLSRRKIANVPRGSFRF